jgi:hypothetical protein
VCGQIILEGGKLSWEDRGREQSAGVHLYCASILRPSIQQLGIQGGRTLLFPPFRGTNVTHRIQRPKVTRTRTWTSVVLRDCREGQVVAVVEEDGTFIVSQGRSPAVDAEEAGSNTLGLGLTFALAANEGRRRTWQMPHNKAARGRYLGARGRNVYHSYKVGTRR